MHSFPEITLLITHFNRSRSLENMLKTFRNLGCEFGEVVVSDDGSDVAHLDYIKALTE